MPKLTYRAQTSDDPVFTRVGAYAFEHGKAVDVDDATAERLSGNPWFSGGKAAKQDAAERAASGAIEGGDSSVNVAYPPGEGSKYSPPAVKTEAGMVPADDAEADEAIGSYLIKHKGRGRYDVLSGEETVQTGLTKDEAEDWVRARSV